MRLWASRVSWALLVLALASTGYLHLTRGVARGLSAKDTSRLERGDLNPGQTTEYVVDLLVSSSCGACRRLAEESEGLLDGLRPALETQLIAPGDSLTRVIVRVHGLDADPGQGYRFASSFGEADEVTAGRRWLNGAAIELLFRDNVGSPEVPQIVIRSRQLTVIPPFVRISDDEVLLRKMGVDELLRWRDSGYPFRVR